jgi:uncharacterized protein DUF6114
VATMSSARDRFRRWRRTRPFWGGLFLIVSALELFFSGNLTLKNIQVHIGQQGFLSYLLPAILILCGVLVWATPGQRLFYGIIGLLTALYSFLGLNLGGFFLGMLIGIVGGALVIAWGPPRAKPAAPDVLPDQADGEAGDDRPDDDHETGEPAGDRRREPEDGFDEAGETIDMPAHGSREAAGGDTGESVRLHRPYVEESPTAIVPGFPDRHDPEPPAPPTGGIHRKTLVITLVPLALTMAVLALGKAAPARAENDCPDGLPSRSTSASEQQKTSSEQQKTSLTKKQNPAAGTSTVTAAKKTTTVDKAAEPAAGGTATSSATPDPAPSAPAGGTGNPLVDGWNNLVDGVGHLLGVGGDESASPTPAPTPSPSATAPAKPPATTGPGTTGPATTGPAPSGPASPSAGASSPGPGGDAADPKGTASPSPSLSDVPCLGPRVFKQAAPGGVPPVSIHGGLLEGKSLNMYQSTYDGTVDLRTADGPIKVLKFSMDKSVTEPFSLTMDEPGGYQTVIKSKKLTTDKNVEFYTPRFEGKLFGLIPVVFSPQSPPPLTLPWLYFSDVKINLAFVSCDTLTAEPLSVTEL